MFDAYTVKKVLPRLVIAAILIQLSWEIFTLLISLVSQIAWGLEGLLYAPFGGREALSLKDLIENSALRSDAAAGITFAGIGIAVGSAISSGYLLLLALSAFLGILLAFFLLTIRELVIIMLVVIAPLALVAWILPNTEKFWKLWWESFTKLLLIYPLILLIVAMGRVFAKITIDSGTANAIFDLLIIVIGFFGPYYLIPKTFQVAGSAFTFLAGMTNDRARGAFDRLKNARQKSAAGTWEKTKENRRWVGNPASRRLGRALQTATLAPKMGYKPWQAGGRIAAARDRINQEAMAKIAKESAEFKAIENDDGLLTAGIENDSEAEVRAYLRRQGQSGAELAQNVSAVMAAKRSLGAQFTGAAIVAKAGTGSGYSGKEGAGTMMQDIVRASRGNRSMERSLYAQAKSAAGNARRYDIAGTSFSTALGVLDAVREGNMDARQASDTMTASALESQGAGAVLAGRMDSVENFIPQLQHRIANSYGNVVAASTALANAQASGDPAMITTAQDAYGQAQREFEQQIASTDALIDVAGSASPEVARAIANGVHSMELPIGTLPADQRDFYATLPDGTRTTEQTRTVRDVMSRLQGEEAYKQMRRTYGSEYERQVGQGQGPSVGPGAGGPGTTPSAGPPPTGIT